MLIHALSIFVTGYFMALILVPMLRQWAIDRGTVDQPDARRIHTQPTPRLGGIAIATATIFCVFVFLEVDPLQKGILAGGIIIYLTGLIDDLRGLAPRYKFLGQFAACGVTIALSGLTIHNLGNLLGTGDLLLPTWLALPFTCFAVIGVINAINLIDGLDGLAGGISVIALTTFTLLAFLTGNLAVLGLSAALLGGLLGFLKYNFYPARIFMGDAGSLFVGYLLAFLAIALTQGEEATVQPVLPVLILGLPIIDTIWVMTSRLSKGQSPFRADLSHLHHKFLDLGFQHRFTVIIIYAISLFWAGFALLFNRAPAWLLLLSYVALSLASYLLLRHLLRHPGSVRWLSRDSMEGVRESVTYRRLAGYAEATVPAMLALLGLYLLLAIYVGCSQCERIWPLTGGLLLAIVAAHLFGRSPRRTLLVVCLYLSGLVIIYLLRSFGGAYQLAGLPLSRLADGVIGTIGLLVLLKYLFRRPGDFFLTSVDFLVLGITILLAIFFHHLQPLPGLGGALLRGVILFHALKVIVSSQRVRTEFIVYGILLTLLSITLRGLLTELF